MTVWPDHLTERLLRLDAHKWRSLRSKVRWSYQNYNYHAVGILAEYMRMLPEDPIEWREYAKGVNARRRSARTVELRREKRRKEKQKAKAHKRYMKDYMRDYRAGVKRRVSK